ncbi:MULTISPECIES: hypothetical protein [Mycetocola]|uniref:hypothetical protein n=1 Tax=Mycetocola TaxID=76634 RepID=UPI0012DD16D1|nr:MULTISPECIES: hypothetical protein [Mycetocola]
MTDWNVDDYTPAELAQRARTKRRRAWIAGIVAFALVASSLLGTLAALGILS